MKGSYWFKHAHRIVLHQNFCTNRTAKSLIAYLLLWFSYKRMSPSVYFALISAWRNRVFSRTWFLWFSILCNTTLDSRIRHEIKMVTCEYGVARNIVWPIEKFDSHVSLKRITQSNPIHSPVKYIILLRSFEHLSPTKIDSFLWRFIVLHFIE